MLTNKSESPASSHVSTLTLAGFTTLAGRSHVRDVAVTATMVPASCASTTSTAGRHLSERLPSVRHAGARVENQQVALHCVGVVAEKHNITNGESFGFAKVRE
jgi:hypothetical protein